jgi:hypothetical protein
VSKRRSAKGNNVSQQDGHDLTAVTAMVESMWGAAEKADPPMSDWLHKKIVADIGKLKRQVDGKLKLASVAARVSDHQRTLFSEHEFCSELAEEAAPPPLAASEEVPRFPDVNLRVYAKDFAPQAVTAIPQAADFSNVEEYREHLAATLPFNAVATRRRAANFLIGRYFPGDRLHEDVKLFARAANGSQSLAEALFYLTCRIEKIVALVAESLVWPSLAEGSIPRAKVKESVAEQLPESKSAKQMTSAIFRTYEVFGVGKTTRTKLLVSQRHGTLPAFAYILHLEFPEPGMYTFDSLLQGPMQKWLVWDHAWMTEQLYALRQAKLLSKVSEIDSHRQFTTRFTLTEAMDRIVKLAQEQQT